MANLIDLSHTYTLIQVIGDKAETFLQGQLTADMREISPTQTRLAAHCNAKGRVLSSFYVLQYDQEYYLCAPCDMAEHIIQQLTPYARLSKVSLKIVDPQISTIDLALDHIPASALLGIRAGIAMIHPETSGLFTPDMLNYPALNAVSFKKGCYIGQEIIARTHYLGKGKRHLTYMQSPTDPRPDPTIVNIVFNADQNVFEYLAVTAAPG